MVSAGAGSLSAGGKTLRVGDSLRLWHGEQVQLQNLGVEAPAEFSWTYCVTQPSWLASARAVIGRAMKSWGFNAGK
ncbi:hypothetical protein D3C71_1766000 [compost metagenome]